MALHRSTVHTAAWAGLWLVTSWEQRGWKKVCLGPCSHLLECKLSLSSSVRSASLLRTASLLSQLLAACVKWLSSVAPHCHSALQPAMDGLHFALACLSLELRWDCRQSVSHTTVLLLSTLPSLLPTKAELQARHHRIRPKLESSAGLWPFRCVVVVEVALRYRSSVTCINRLWSRVSE